MQYPGLVVDSIYNYPIYFKLRLTLSSTNPKPFTILNGI